MKKIDQILSRSLVFLMICQAASGLMGKGFYRDSDWIKATWFGNDLVTLIIVSPILLVSIHLAMRGSVRAELLRLGSFGYGIYNYSFYLFGAALNCFFPLYVFSLIISITALIFGLIHLDIVGLSKSFSNRTPNRILGGYYTFVAFGLSIIWFGMWAAFIFAGRPTPVETEAFKIVAALDTTIMVPVLFVGGVLLWQRHQWGFAISAIGGVQASLYLLVLSVNSIISIRLGFAEFPGELPAWGILMISTLLATGIMFFYLKTMDTSESNMGVHLTNNLKLRDNRKDT